jgi:hypothetical protein
MSGFEHQVASHMMAEGMVLESLAITRAIHDRYHASRRNPWNEVECSDHYARAMASYGTFIAACGFECDGPKHHLGFAPRLTPENFKCAFTSAQGWGSFSQKRAGKRLDAEITVRSGKLRLRTVALALPDGASAATVLARLGRTEISAALSASGGRALITVAKEIELSPQQHLQLTLT